MDTIVSIIIATFNSGKLIKTALDSIRNQSYQNWECLIIDGVSKDETISILEEYQSLDKRFRYISEPDKGIYDALNKGVSLAKGEWIYVLGSDDTITKDGLFRMMNNNDVCDVKCGNIIFNNNGSLKYNKSTSNLNQLRKNMIYSHQAIIMKKKIFEEIGYFNLEYSISADYDLILRAYLNGYRFQYYDIFLAIFNVGGYSNVLFNTDLFRIRKTLHSVSTLTNLYLFLRRTLGIIFKSINNLYIYYSVCSLIKANICSYKKYNAKNIRLSYVIIIK